MGDFGNELRLRRVAAGLSLRNLSGRVQFSAGYLSKIETGTKAPTPELARACDAALEADGHLTGLVPPRTATAEPAVGQNGDLWTMRLTGDGSGEFAITSGDAERVQHTLMRWTTAPRATAHSLAVYRRWFDDIRTLGQVNPPHTVVPILITVCKTLQNVSDEAREPALRLAARYAEYTGWMAQEAGDEAAAVWWTTEAVRLSAEAGDPELAAYALVRRAELALYRGDFLATIDLSRQAREQSARPLVQAMATQREAQGHAAAGHEKEYRRLLRAAAELTAAAVTEDSAEPVLGTTNLRDPLAFVEGWCLHDLGRHDEAAEVLGAELARIPEWAGRARARCGARLALALAASGAVDEACEVLDDIVELAALIDSATIRRDLRDVYRRLGRWRTRPDVERILSRLSPLLRQAQSTNSIGTRS
ncbi:helix-turn-helix transcriptional regulator [Actinoplanes sp. NEAU-A12]|uniref:Helix-turn-helix transcriptional regulator n=1 Tax=Actinoplanes sandaracinus TaxID=3045177 RepID=A0ABT6WY18_9ACTN|nr:helix-turn-helix transcriptional regulator [Actinoplanes sandaracinus]MDI6104634.1 helix-turn-helix transcriptional regulator [Actinoplanes sandaracinus]